MAGRPQLEVLLSAPAVRETVERLAEEIAPTLDDKAVVACVLTGGMWFAADLTRALAARDRHPLFDALWLTSYGNAQASGGTLSIRAELQRPVSGRDVLLLDDVLETGLSLAEGVRLIRAAGAVRVRTAVFARKPQAAGAQTSATRLQPDFVGWEAPARFLVGYGMDWAGRYRGLAEVAAAD